MNALLQNNLISTKEAAKRSGYSPDYVSRLCREGKVRAVQVGRTWLIEQDSFESFMAAQLDRKIELAESLAREREREYQKANTAVNHVSRFTRVLEEKTVEALSPLVTTFSRSLERSASLITGPAFATALTALVLMGGVMLAGTGVLAQTGRSFVATAFAVRSQVLSGVEAIDAGFAARHTAITQFQENEEAKRVALFATAANEDMATLPTHVLQRAEEMHEPVTVVADAYDRVTLIAATYPTPKTTKEFFAFAHNPQHTLRATRDAVVTAYLRIGVYALSDIDAITEMHARLIVGASDVLLASVTAIHDLPQTITGAEVAIGNHLIDTSHAVMDGYERAVYAYVTSVETIPQTLVGSALTIGDVVADTVATGIVHTPNTYEETIATFVNHSSSFGDALSTSAFAFGADTHGTVHALLASEDAAVVEGVTALKLGTGTGFAALERQTEDVMNLPRQAEIYALGVAGTIALQMEQEQEALPASPLAAIDIGAYMPEAVREIPYVLAHATRNLFHGVFGPIASFFNAMDDARIAVIPFEEVSIDRPSGDMLVGSPIYNGTTTITNATGPVTIIRNEYPTVAYAGVSQAYVDERFEFLRRVLYGNIEEVVDHLSDGTNSNGGGGTGGITSLDGLSGTGLTLTNSTWNGGTVSATSITTNTLTAGTSTFNGNATVNGDLSITGTLTAGTLAVSSLAVNGPLVGPYFTATSTTGTSTFPNVAITNAEVTNGVITNATSTNFFATTARITNGVIDSLTSPLASITTALVTNLTATNAVITNATSTNLYTQNAVAQNATTTNLFTTNARISNGTIDAFTTTNATATNQYVQNLGVANATSTNFFATTARITNGVIDSLTAPLAIITDAIITNLTATNATLTNATSTNATSTNFYAQNAVAQNATSTNLFATSFRATIANIVDAFFTNITADLATLANALVTNLTATNATLTNATTTNATSTNLFTQRLVSGNATTTNFFATSAHITTGVIDAFTSPFATLTDAIITNLTATNATLTKATSTNATTTGSLALTYVTPGRILSTNAGGQVQATNLTSWVGGTANQITVGDNGSGGVTLSLPSTIIFGSSQPTTLGSDGATSTFGGGIDAARVYSRDYIAGPYVLAASTTATSAFSGNIAVGRNATLGTSGSDSLVINSRIASNLIPAANITYSLGSVSNYWKEAFIDELNVNNISVASTSISGTVSEVFTINSDNSSNDTEDMSLVFNRGLAPESATITWSTANQRFEFNMPIFSNNGIFTNATNTTLTVTGTARFSSGVTVNNETITDFTGTNLTNTGGSLGLSTSYAGQSSITTVGTITSGTWNGTAVDVAYGGTGATTLTGLLIGNGTSAFTATTTSAGLASIISDEQGIGSLVFNISPTFAGTAIFDLVSGSGAIFTNATTTNATSTDFFATLLRATTGTITSLTATNASTSALTNTTALYNSYLTAGRIPYTTTAGLLTDDSDLTFNGITLTATGLSATNASTTALTVTGRLYDTRGIAGTAGQILQSTGTSTIWVATSSLAGSFFTQNGNSFGTGAVLGTNDLNDLQFETNGTTSLTINTDGYVGIGTTNPLAPFHVQSNAFSGSEYLAGVFNNFSLAQNTATRIRLGNSTNAVSNTVGGATDLISTRQNDGSSDFSISQSISTTTITNRFFIDGSTGNVGIGTQSPLARLSLVGVAGTDIFGIASSSGTRLLTVTSAGALGVGTSSPSGLLTAVATTSAPTLVIEQKGTGAAALFLGGNAGFGTTTPNDTVSVEGTFNLTGALKVSGDAGTTGMILKSNGAGAPTWIATSTLGIAISDTTGVLAVNRGGTGLSSTPTNGQLLIGNGTGYTLATITGTNNRVSVTVGAGSITLSGPQDLQTTSTPQFSRIGLGTTPNASVPLTVSATSTSYIVPLARFINASTTNLGNGSRMVFVASRTTAGATDLASIEGFITDVTTSAYKGALTFSTANNATPAERMRIDYLGNVGIGTTSMGAGTTSGALGARLAVTGASGATTTLFQVSSSTDASLFAVNPDGSISFSGQVGTAGQLLQSMGTGLAPQWVGTSTLAGSFFVQNGNSFGTTATLGTNDSNNLQFETNNITRLVIDTTGNVGIGAASPSARLVVAGQTIGEYFTATSTTAVNTFPLASTTVLTTGSGLYNTYLTAGRVPFTTTAGLLTDSTNLTFNGTTLTTLGFSTTNASTTNLTVSGTSFLNIATGTGAIFTNATTTNATSTDFFATLLRATTGTITSLTATNASTSVLTTATAHFNTYLTSGRVPYTTTAGLMTDSANLTFNGTTLTATGLSATNASTTALTLASQLYDSRGVAGTFGQFLQSTGTSTTWVSTSTIIGGSYFIHDGNTLGMTAIIGTNDANNLEFETNGTSRAALDTSGNFGIGTLSPVANLHVQSSASSGSEYFAALFNNFSTAANSATRLRLGNSVSGINSNIGGAVDFISTRQSDGSADFSLAISSSTSSIATRLYIDGSTGNIGVGTTTPGQKLTVDGGNLQISPGIARQSYVFSGRTDLTYPVPYVTPAEDNSIVAFDIFPRGTPTNIGSNGYAWMDICDADVVNVGTPFNCLRAGINDDAVTFGNLSFGTTSVQHYATTTGTTTAYFYGVPFTYYATNSDATSTFSVALPPKPIVFWGGSGGNEVLRITSSASTSLMASRLLVGNIFGGHSDARVRANLHVYSDFSTTSLLIGARGAPLGSSTAGTSTEIAATLAFRTLDISTDVGNAVEIVTGRDSTYSSAANRDANLQFWVELDNDLVERMRITSAGFVGIGTSSPVTRLDVSGTSNTTNPLTFTSAITSAITNISTTANNFSALSFRTLDSGSIATTTSQILGIHTSHASTTGASGALAFFTTSAGVPAERMRISETGQITGQYFTSSSTSANTFTNASTSVLTTATAHFNTYLTSGRVPYTTTAGLMTDSANLTFNGTTLTATGLSATNASTTALTVSGRLYDSTGVSGTNGQILLSTGTATTWVSTSTLGFSTSTLSLDTQYFKQNGNSFGAAAVLGTNDSNDLQFKTNGSTRVTINSNGNVGIGIPAPTGKLSVHDNSGGASTTPLFVISSSTAANLSTSTLFSVLGNGGVTIGSVSNALVTMVGSSGVTISSTLAPGLGIESTATSSANAGGGLGLYSNDGAAMASGDRLGGLFFGGASSATTLRHTALIGAFANEAWVDGASYGTDLVFQNTASGATTRSEKMRLTGSGNLGIGSSTPGARLVVVGQTIGEYFTSTSTTASSTLPNLLTTNLRISGMLHDSAASSGTNGMILQTTGSGVTWVATSSLGFSTSTLSLDTQYFKQNGNSFGATATLGTNDANNLVFETNNTARLTIDTNGNVGIGTSTPDSLLHLAASDTGTTITSASAAMLNITNRGTTDRNFSDIAFSAADSANVTVVTSKISGVHTSHTAGATSGELAFLTRNAGTLTEKMRITAAGQVGINMVLPVAATSSTAFLTVAASSTATSTWPQQLELRSARAAIQLSNPFIGGILFRSNDTSPGIGDPGLPVAAINAEASGTHTAATLSTDIVIYNTAAGSVTPVEMMRLTQAGRLGIGTPAPTQALDVVGAMVIRDGRATGGLKLGADVNGTTYTTSTRKVGVITAPDFAGTGLVEFFSFNSPDVNTNDVFVGGRVGGTNNAATGITFVTNASTTQTGGSARMTITGAGLVGIGSTTPAALLTVSSSTTSFLFSVATTTNTSAGLFNVLGSGRVGIGTSTPTAQLHTTGTVRFSNFAAGTLQTDADGNVSVSSDERLKNINGAFTQGLSAIMGINPVNYHWKASTGYDTDYMYTGFSAQNVQSVLPEAVGADSRGYLTLSDRPILAAAINAVKELAGRTDILGKATTTLGSRLSVIERTLTTEEAPKPVTATVITGDTLTITGIGAFTTLTATGTVSAATFTTSADALAFEIGDETVTTDLASDVLTGGDADLFKMASFALAQTQVLTKRTDLIIERLDSIEERLAAMETSASSTSATVGLSIASLKEVLADLGVVIEDGIASFNNLVFRQLAVAKDENGSSSAGSMTILAGNTTIEVDNVYVLPTSKIFVTFTSPVTGAWYISHKEEGSFRVTLDTAQPSDVSFDYFILQTEGQLASPSAARTEEQPEAPAPTTPFTPVFPTTGTTTPETGTSTATTTANSDTRAPFIRLTGNAAVELQQGNTWTDPGAEASDDVDGDLTAQIQVSGSVDSNTLGLYTISYSVSDAAGNEGHVSRVVTVVSSPAPAPTPEPAPSPAPEPTI